MGPSPNGYKTLQYIANVFGHLPDNKNFQPVGHDFHRAHISDIYIMIHNSSKVTVIRVQQK